MAIVGLLIMGTPEDMHTIRNLLAQESGIVDVQPTEDATRVAVVLETGADKVEAAMTRMLAWEGVLSVDLAYVNYEDDVEAGGIACPPHTSRKMREAGE